MKKKIRAYDELVLEEQRLEEALELHQRSITDKWLHLKASLQPAMLGMKLAENTFTRAKTTPAITMGTNFVIDLVVKKWILKKSGWMTKMLIPFVIKNITSNVIQKKMLRAPKPPVS